MDFDTNDTALAHAVYTTTSLVDDMVVTLKKIVDLVDENGKCRLNPVTIELLITVLQYQNHLIKSCYELQAETMDRVETFIHSLNNR